MICYVDEQALDTLWLKFRFENAETSAIITPSDIATLLNLSLDIDKFTFSSIFNLFSDVISSFKGVSIFENFDASPSLFAIEIGQEEQFTCDQCGKVYPSLLQLDTHKYCKSCLEGLQQLQSPESEKKTVKMRVSIESIPPAIKKNWKKPEYPYQEFSNELLRLLVLKMKNPDITSSKIMIRPKICK